MPARAGATFGSAGLQPASDVPPFEIGAIDLTYVALRGPTLPRLLNVFIDPFVVLKRHEVRSEQSGGAGLQPAPARELELHVAGLACTSI